MRPSPETQGHGMNAWRKNMERPGNLRQGVEGAIGRKKRPSLESDVRSCLAYSHDNHEYAYAYTNIYSFNPYDDHSTQSIYLHIRDTNIHTFIMFSLGRTIWTKPCTTPDSSNN